MYYITVERYGYMIHRRCIYQFVCHSSNNRCENSKNVTTGW